MTRNLLFRMLTMLPAALLAAGAYAQDQPEMPAAPEPEMPAEAVQAVPALPPEEEIRIDATSLWRLLGGGEVVGELVKETPAETFIDIGPRIISVPTNSIVSRLNLTEITEETDARAGLGTGVFDPETGSVVFRAREGAGDILSQQQVLDNVKRGVVVVSNPAGMGTGWVLNRDGDIVTNHHVVGNETYQTVTIFVKRGDQWERRRIENCTVEAFSSRLDIAIVRLDMDKVREQGIELYPLSIAETGALEAGDPVFAIGNPGMGMMVLEHTISEGIVSSLQRNFDDVIYLQTTAPVNPGNSGGPLVNERGQVVGLITLKAFFQEGVAFALPVEYIHHFLRNRKAYAVDETNRNRGYRYHRPQ